MISSDIVGDKNIQDLYNSFTFLLQFKVLSKLFKSLHNIKETNILVLTNFFNNNSK